MHTTPSCFRFAAVAYGACALACAAHAHDARDELHDRLPRRLLILPQLGMAVAADATGAGVVATRLPLGPGGPVTADLSQWDGLGLAAWSGGAYDLPRSFAIRVSDGEATATLTRIAGRPFHDGTAWFDFEEFQGIQHVNLKHVRAISIEFLSSRRSPTFRADVAALNDDGEKDAPGSPPIPSPGSAWTLLVAAAAALARRRRAWSQFAFQSPKCASGQHRRRIWRCEASAFPKKRTALRVRSTRSRATRAPHIQYASLYPPSTTRTRVISVCKL